MIHVDIFAVHKKMDYSLLIGVKKERFEVLLHDGLLDEVNYAPLYRCVHHLITNEPSIWSSTILKEPVQRAADPRDPSSQHCAVPGIHTRHDQRPKRPHHRPRPQQERQ